jgi:hypothetical protein
LGATNINKFCGGCFFGIEIGLCCKTAITIPALSKALAISDPSIGGVAVICTPNAAPCNHKFWFVYNGFATPAAWKTQSNSLANVKASGSPFCHSTNTSNDGAISLRSSTSCRNCSAERWRHAVIRINSAVRSRASAASFSSLAARVFASEARSVADMTLSFDLRRSSFCIPASFLLVVRI